jgi:phospholipase C
VFASDIDGSFVAHQYLIAGQSNAEADYPTGPWGCTGGPTDLVQQLGLNRVLKIKRVSPCQDYQTLADEMDTAGVTWRMYAPPVPPTGSTPDSIWSAFQAIKHIYQGPDWANDVISPPTQILTDVPGGTLAAVTWVIPGWTYSDHALSLSTTGPGWVAQVVNAIGQSQFWSNTAIFVVWDDWGGWYDHVKPPYLDFDGLGFRVPMICISPYAPQGVIAHGQFEFGSVLRFVENDFALAQLGHSDTRAKPADAGCLKYSQTPRTFTPFSTTFKRADLERIQRAAPRTRIGAGGD